MDDKNTFKNIKQTQSSYQITFVFKILPIISYLSYFTA